MIEQDALFLVGWSFKNWHSTGPCLIKRVSHMHTYEKSSRQREQLKVGLKVGLTWAADPTLLPFLQWMHKQPPHLLLISWSHQIGGHLPSYIPQAPGALSHGKRNLPEGLMLKKKKKWGQARVYRIRQVSDHLDRGITKFFFLFWDGNFWNSYWNFWSCDFYH